MAKALTIEDLKDNEHVQDFVRVLPALVTEENYSELRYQLNCVFTSKMQAAGELHVRAGVFVKMQTDVPRAYRYARALLDEKLREGTPAYWVRLKENEVIYG